MKIKQDIFLLSLFEKFGFDCYTLADLLLCCFLFLFILVIFIFCIIFIFIFSFTYPKYCGIILLLSLILYKADKIKLEYV